MSFTAIEIAVILTDFFLQKKIDLKLKWPNDLWTLDKKKCGGILIQGSQHQFLAGIGLNIHSTDPNFGGIFEKPSVFEKKELALEISNFIQENRISQVEELRQKWLSRCGHNLEKVKIIEDRIVTEGIFLGLGNFGEALISTPEGLKSVFNGSLRLA